MDIEAYLQRINYSGSLSPDALTLRDLQLAHLLSVPFENLSIHAGEPIVIQEEALFDKVVSRRRGGFCYELNGLFAALLRESGFNVSMLSAGVARPEGGFGPDFDHMTLLVLLEERWLVDVGFGDSFREPLLLDSRDVQAFGDRSYRIDAGGEHLTLLESSQGGEWKPQFRFTLRPYQYADYEEMCRYHQTSPDSPFTQRRICSLATANGRVTLSDRRLILTGGVDREEQELIDEGAYLLALKNRFDITMTT